MKCSLILFTIEELLKISVRSAEGGAPWCCASKWRSTFACLALLENKLDSNPELTTMMFLTDQFASLAKLSGEKILYENTGLYLKDLDGKFGKLLAILRDTGGLSGLDCVVDDDFSHWYNPSEDKAIAFEEQDTSVRLRCGSLNEFVHCMCESEDCWKFLLVKQLG